MTKPGWLTLLNAVNCTGTVFLNLSIKILRAAIDFGEIYPQFCLKSSHDLVCKNNGTFKKMPRINRIKWRSFVNGDESDQAENCSHLLCKKTHPPNAWPLHRPELPGTRVGYLWTILPECLIPSAIKTFELNPINPNWLLIWWTTSRIRLNWVAIGCNTQIPQKTPPRGSRPQTAPDTNEFLWNLSHYPTIYTSKIPGIDSSFLWLPFLPRLFHTRVIYSVTPVWSVDLVQGDICYVLEDERERVTGRTHTSTRALDTRLGSFLPTQYRNDFMACHHFVKFLHEIQPFSKQLSRQVPQTKNSLPYSAWLRWHQCPPFLYSHKVQKQILAEFATLAVRLILRTLWAFLKETKGNGATNSYHHPRVDFTSVTDSWPVLNSFGR